jgi:Ca2+-binding RTX toxin-like protein
VITNTSYALTAGAVVEVLRTFGSSSTAIINLTGNEFANELQGNAANNILDGRGGADRMVGFAGNDTYRVDQALDKPIESVGKGNDTVLVVAASTFALQAGSEIELLRTLGSSNTAKINLTGNAFGQAVYGNAAGNIINGGAGNDTLVGFGGKDFFRFDTALNAATNVDSVSDFSVPNDTIQLQNAIFTALTTTGTLAASAFNTGTAAKQADDRIIYNKANGDLRYDADGTGSAASIKFAQLDAGLALTRFDFVVV